MRNRLKKLGWSKKIKKRQIDSQNITSNIESSIDKLFLKRIERLKSVKRFVLGWLGLFLITIIILVIQFNNLNNYYLSTNFVKGGIYSEGLEGTFTNANPIYSIGDANSSVSKLIFAGLLTYDNRGKLIGDLAKNWEINNRGNEYTVHLKPNIFWQDGVPLTAKDIVFTFNTIENADAQSPLFANWQDVQVSAINKSTVSFKLPGELASFPNNLTTGIIPEHLLKNISPQNLRSASFNTIHPIGAGPFSWGSINEKNTENSDQGILQISFNPFSKYVNGRPKLDQFFMNIYANQNKMYEDFKNKSLTAIAAVNTPPSSVFEGAGVIKHNLILRAANMVFFKTSTGVLSDQSVRQALGEATNQKDILNHLGYMTVPVKEPLLIGQLGYNPIYAQSPFNLSAAK
ncbi:MAG TPA: ABC transporter substrate-binding protein, partial [Patescibacteria group bacterium]|nr:ABC transporter substrate-binding protein [Patescibacteria group bacterium]